MLFSSSISDIFLAIFKYKFNLNLIFDKLFFSLELVRIWVIFSVKRNDGINIVRKNQPSSKTVDNQLRAPYKVFTLFRYWMNAERAARFWTWRNQRTDDFSTCAYYAAKGNRYGSTEEAVEKGEFSFTVLKKKSIFWWAIEENKM